VVAAASALKSLCGARSMHHHYTTKMMTINANFPRSSFFLIRRSGGSERLSYYLLRAAAGDPMHIRLCTILHFLFRFDIHFVSSTAFRRFAREPARGFTGRESLVVHFISVLH